MHSNWRRSWKFFNVFQSNPLEGCNHSLDLRGAFLNSKSRSHFKRHIFKLDLRRYSLQLLHSEEKDIFLENLVDQCLNVGLTFFLRLFLTATTFFISLNVVGMKPFEDVNATHMTLLNKFQHSLFLR